MAVITKGTKLAYKTGEAGEYTILTDLQEFPDLGGTTDAIDITTLDDAAYMYTDGLKNYGDSLEFKFLYAEQQFTALNQLSGSVKWQVQLADGATCSFGGTSSVKLDGAGVNTALTYTLAVKPNSEMIWA